MSSFCSVPWLRKSKGEIVAQPNGG
jgi:hypothetical protein